MFLEGFIQDLFMNVKTKATLWFTREHRFIILYKFIFRQILELFSSWKLLKLKIFQHFEGFWSSSWASKFKTFLKLNMIQNVLYFKGSNLSNASKKVHTSLKNSSIFLIPKFMFMRYFQTRKNAPKFTVQKIDTDLWKPSKKTLKTSKIWKYLKINLKSN